MSTTDRKNLLPHLQQALSMLELNPEHELGRYRRYKKGELDAVKTFESAELIERPGGMGPLNRAFTTAGMVNMTDEEEEDYEVIPPSQSFVVYDKEASEPSNAIQSTPLDNEIPAGEMVLRSPAPVSDNLNLSLRTPGSITPPAEYSPASQDLIRSFGSTPALTKIQIPKWKMPLAIGSSLVAIAAVGGMSYVNMHPALLKRVPVVAQLTATPVLPVVPPGEVLQGPDLAMGEFSDLSLSNINSLTVPGTEIAKTATPNAPTTIAPNSSPAIGAALPQPAFAAPSVATAAPTSRLADGLIRSLLPPSIQQLSGQQSPAANPMADQFYYQPPAATASPTNGYTVFAKSVNPRSLAKIQSLVPKATMQGDRVFLGNFPNQVAASGVVKQMQEQGIKAWLVKP